MRRLAFAPVLLLVLCLAFGDGTPAWAEKKAAKAASEAEESPTLDAGTFAGLQLRNIGPALTSGRIIDLAVHPEDPDTFYVGTAGGGVWKTTNHGVSFSPIFDGQGSSSIGCITIDAKNPNVVWVGTGENNSQRSVAYGDGLYKSVDGGRSWKKVGLENSEHIAKIVIDPRDSDTVLVAVQGPLWSPGGDRGLYRTRDGGETWTRVLEISENTGVTDLLMDPRDPDRLIAAAYQRRRHVWTLINGGPESGLWASDDQGETWRELKSGLPSGHVGRIGLASSPVDPDVLYGIIEAADGGGFYRSTDRGASWSKRSGYVSGSPQYYQEIFADPHDVDRVYSMDVWMQRTEDGGQSWSRVPETAKHVDNHALWIDPDDPDHLLAGCDGGLYETWDRGDTWKFYENLPITQFYRVAVSNDEPFSYVYGGTQDNFTLGGPTRTTNVHGIANHDWFVTLGGDGFQSQVDPENPDIVYSQLQYGNLVRHDRRSGENIDIQPQAEVDGEPLTWNWDSALGISPHSNTRLYFGADRLFQTDDRGDSWRAISGDLTRQLDRNTFPVMGEVWSIDAVSKNRSTSIYGNLVTVSESPLEEGLIYAGTDDGLVQITENGGETWRAVESESVPGIPERTYVNRVRASRHDADTVFVAFNHHKMGDFAPYLVKSTDRGRTWSSIVGDLPERGSIYAVEQDPKRADLLYVGTETGAYFTLDGGEHWIRFSGGLPTVQIRDLVVHERDDDLVLASFGRGFYVLDDLSPLRAASAELLERDFVGFAPRTALAYHPSTPLGLRGKSFQGDDYHLSPNPPFGAVLTYFVKEAPETREAKRKEREKQLEEEGEPVPYPSWDDLRAEAIEEDPTVYLTIRDADGDVVRRLEGPTGKGFHRVAWDLRHPDPDPIRLSPPDLWNPFMSAPQGPKAVPGRYTVSYSMEVDGERREVGEPQSFEVRPLGLATLPAADRQELLAFQEKTAALQKAVLGAGRAHDDTLERLRYVRRAISETPEADLAWHDEARRIEADLRELETALYGDSVVARAQEPTLPGLMQRLGRVVGGHWDASAAPTATQRRAYEIVSEQLGPWLAELERIVETDLPALEAKLDAAGAPWTPGRVPSWPAGR